MSDALDYEGNAIEIIRVYQEQLYAVTRQRDELLAEKMVEEPLRRKINELKLLLERSNGSLKYFKAEHLAAKARITSLEVVCKKTANAIEYLMERASDSDDYGNSSLPTNFVRECLQNNLNDILVVLSD